MRAPVPRRFTVAGHGEFPIDMLRYDVATPATEQDSGLITRSFRARSGIKCSVNLISLSGSEPTSGRWESFGWKVV